jgi:hypothetical protein
MNDHGYTSLHIHPTFQTVVEIVAYQRIDCGWDVFVFEPPGACPELESGRVDDQHIFIQWIETEREIDQVADEIENRLGAAYQRVTYYREIGTQRTIQSIEDHLLQNGATGLLFIRRKDFPLLPRFSPRILNSAHLCRFFDKRTTLF